MNIKLIDKKDPTEIRYTIELGQSQLINIIGVFTRIIANAEDTAPELNNWKRIRDELKEMFNASTTN